MNYKNNRLMATSKYNEARQLLIDNERYEDVIKFHQNAFILTAILTAKRKHLTFHAENQAFIFLFRGPTWA